MQAHLPETDPAREDIAACRAMLRGGSRTFFAASLLLPRAVREPASVLYAFCRQADDAVDNPGARADAVAGLRERLERAYAGTSFAHPADRALALVVRRHGIPKALPAALLEGLEWDCAGRRYEDLPALTAYAARVAGAVGAMMSLLMGARSPLALARACDLGVAMQFSNIARDVGEDARAGRLYLPAQWMRQAGLDPQAWLAAPAFSPALGTVVQRLLDHAEALYARVGAGVACLPTGCRPGINAAQLLYAEIGREVARAGHDSIHSRAVVSTPRKLGLLAVAALASMSPARGNGTAEPALPECDFLVEAALAAPAPQPAQGHHAGYVSHAGLAGHAGQMRPGAPPWQGLPQKIERMVELIERLEKRDQLRRLGEEG
jgi:phytoene synthase